MVCRYSVHLACRCVYDTKPRRVDAHTAQIVCNLAELAVRELEREWAVQVARTCFPALLHCTWPCMFWSEVYASEDRAQLHNGALMMAMKLRHWSCVPKCLAQA